MTRHALFIFLTLLNTGCFSRTKRLMENPKTFPVYSAEKVYSNKQGYLAFEAGPQCKGPVFIVGNGAVVEKSLIKGPSVPQFQEAYDNRYAKLNLMPIEIRKQDGWISTTSISSLEFTLISTNSSRIPYEVDGKAISLDSENMEGFSCENAMHEEKRTKQKLLFVPTVIADLMISLAQIVIAPVFLVVVGIMVLFGWGNK